MSFVITEKYAIKKWIHPSEVDNLSQQLNYC